MGRFTIVEGHAREEGPWLGSLIRQHADDAPDELYVVVEPAGPGSEEYTSQLVHVIARLYARDPLSLTGALTRSLRAAHEHLRDWNRKSLKEHRVAAGASCLTLRGNEAYLAQAGPSLAYVFHAGDVTRFQAERMDFDASLGIAESFEPQLQRITLEPGDLVLVASTQLDDVVPPEHMRRLLAQGADDALAELYLLCRDRSNFSLVLLSCFEEAIDEPPPFLTRDAASPTVDAPTDLPASAQGELVAAPAGAGPDTAQASLAASMGEFDLPQRPIHEQVKEITQSTAPPPAAGVRIRGSNAAPRYRRSTGSVPVPRMQVPRLLLLAVAAVLALGLLAWWQLPRSVQESREDRFVSLLADARASNARAQSTGDTGLKRQLLNDAQISLNEAGKIHGDNGELVALKADVAAELAALNAVFEIRDFETVTDLAQQVTGSLAVTESVVGGDHAYFLDAEGGRVLRLALAGGSAPETVLTGGDVRGALTVARPAQIAWSEETDSLIVVDDRRQAFAYFPDSGSLPLVVRGADAWGSLNGATASGGNLYVLDVDGDQVWRYLPGQGGFDSERTALLDTAELENATELAVGQDVYLLDTEMGIRRFSGKDETSFPLSGIDTPLLSPASISVLPGSNRLVVADRGNKRIVVASPDGAFLRQIVSPAFTDLRAVSVDEGNGILYVLNGDTLLRAPFPP